MTTKTLRAISLSGIGRNLTINASLLGALILSATSMQIEVVAEEDEYTEDGKKIRHMLILPGHKFSLRDSEELPKINADLLRNYHRSNKTRERYLKVEIAAGGKWWKKKGRKFK